MKVVKEAVEKNREYVPYSQRLRRSLLQQIDDIAAKNDVSRNRLVEAVLEQALSDPKFTLKLKAGD